MEGGQCPRTPHKLCVYILLHNVGFVYIYSEALLHLWFSDRVRLVMASVFSFYHELRVYDLLNLFWEL